MGSMLISEGDILCDYNYIKFFEMEKSGDGRKLSSH
jgi:hypothetical protein